MDCAVLCGRPLLLSQTRVDLRYTGKSSAQAIWLESINKKMLIARISDKPYSGSWWDGF